MCFGCSDIDISDSLAEMAYTLEDLSKALYLFATYLDK